MNKYAVSSRRANENYRRRHKDAIKQRHEAWRQMNKHKVASYAKKYRQNNKAKCNSDKFKRMYAKELRTPKWLTKEQLKQITAFYIESARLKRETGELYEVDHIVPLHGKIVSGLHVPWNLQILPRNKNRQKSNKLLLIDVIDRT